MPKQIDLTKLRAYLDERVPDYRWFILGIHYNTELDPRIAPHTDTFIWYLPGKSESGTDLHSVSNGVKKGVQIKRINAEARQYIRPVADDIWLDELEGIVQ